MQQVEYTKANMTYWTGRAAGYSAVNQEELETTQHTVWKSTLQNAITSHFGDRKPETIRVLDIGTGPGFFAILLAELGYSVTAVDYTEAMLVEARKNAGALVSRIAFQQMNAEELTFDSHSFDVIVSRNLTWNLHHPDAAYTQWNRVLKEGGLLLNFDANWYRYLHDETAMDAHHADRQNVARQQVADDTAGTDVAEMERIARATPLSRKMRPDWDLHFLKSLGMKAHADQTIWHQVWTEAERVNNASTPMFLVHAVKT